MSMNSEDPVPRRERRVNRDEYDDENPSSGGKSGGSNRSTIVISVIVAVALSLVLTYLFMVNGLSTKVTQELNTAQTTITQMQTDNTKQINNAIAGLPKSADITQQITSAVSALKIPDVNNLATKSDVANLARQSTVDQDTQDIASLKTQIGQLNSDITGIKAQLAATPIPTPTPTPTSSNSSSSTPGSSSTYNNITASISSTSISWNGTPLLTAYLQNANGGTITNIVPDNTAVKYTSAPNIVITGGSPAVVATAVAYPIGNWSDVGGSAILSITGTHGSGYQSVPTVLITDGTHNSTATATVSPIVPFTTSNSFNIQLHNDSTTAGASNIQLAIGLTLTDGNGVPLSSVPTWLIPSGANQNITFSSNSFGSSWAYQSTVSPSTLVFTNSNANAIFSNGLSLSAGQTQTVTEYITIANYNVINTPTLYIYPQIKVLSYQ